MLTASTEKSILDLLRAADQPPVGICFLKPQECYVNVMSSTQMEFDLHSAFSFAPFFSLFSLPAAVRVSSLILAYMYDPQEFLSYFLGHRITINDIPFRAFRDVIARAVEISRIRKACRIIALAELVDEGRIECIDKTWAAFFQVYKAMSKGYFRFAKIFFLIRGIERFEVERPSAALSEARALSSRRGARLCRGSRHSRGVDARNRSKTRSGESFCFLLQL